MYLKTAAPIILLEVILNHYFITGSIKSLPHSHNDVNYIFMMNFDELRLNKDMLTGYGFIYYY